MISRPCSRQRRAVRASRLAFALVAALLVLALAPGMAAPAAASPLVAALGTRVLPAVPAGTPPDWINVTNPAPGKSPPAAYGAAMAYDPVDHETILFGGCRVSTCADAETWAFANGTWANLTDPRHAPPARSFASMDFDPNMGGLLLFGGSGASGDLGDTWLFHHGTWTNLSWIGPSPPPRTGAAMAFDPQPEENGSVLFGGNVQGVGYANDTWIWQGWSGWVPLVPSAVPPATAYGALAYDPIDGALVLYRPDAVNQTWELYSGQWWFLSPSGAVPAYDYYAAATYDPALSEVVMFGGLDLGGVVGTTSTFAGNAWSTLGTATAPAPRLAPALALDPSGSVPLLFGGANFTQSFNDTWVLEIPVSASLAASAPSPETSAPVTFTATADGGTPPYTARFDFGDHTSAMVTSSQTPLTATHAYDAPGSYTPSVTVADSVGASATASTPALTIAAGPAVAASVSPGATDVGKGFLFESHATAAGIPPLTYAWSFSDGATAPAQNATHAFAAPGSYSGTVEVTDSVGGTASATVGVHVNPLPAVSPSVATASPTSGTPVVLSANLTGGTAPFTYAWSFGDGTTSTSPSASHTFNVSGTYTLQVWVNDSAGGSAHGTISVDVASVTAAGAETPLWFWGGLVALIAVAAVVAVFLVRASRRGRPPNPNVSAQEPGAVTGAPSAPPTKPESPEDEL